MSTCSENTDNVRDKALTRGKTTRRGRGRGPARFNYSSSKHLQVLEVQTKVNLPLFMLYWLSVPVLLR